MTSGDGPRIRACWLSWIAVRTVDVDDLVGRLGLSAVGRMTWDDGAALVDELAHDRGRFHTVVVAPTVRGWTLVFGGWCDLTYLENVVHVTEVCQELSRTFGRAQAFAHSEGRDGEAWLLAEDGRTVRRFISEYPELARGEPVGAERRFLDLAGIAGRPEDLDPDGDEAADWPYGVDCVATEIAREESLDPTGIGSADTAAEGMLVARAPRFELADPITGVAPYLGKSSLP